MTEDRVHTNNMSVICCLFDILSSAVVLWHLIMRELKKRQSEVREVHL
jgi:hypothetical protein